MISRIKKSFILVVIFCVIFISCTSDSIVDLEKQLKNKGYEVTFTDEFPTKVYHSFFTTNDIPFGQYPFIYEVTKKNRNYTTIYKYYFDDFGYEMINRYVIIILIKNNGFYKIYENENIHSQKNTVVKLNKSITNGVTGEVIENPVLYLWE